MRAPAPTLQTVIAEAQACHLCPRMEGRRRVLGTANGTATAEVIVIATAPGRAGAERTGIPLCGDRSGDLFEDLLRVNGLERDRLFVSNAVLCNPQDAAGRNAEPTRQEIANCARHLRAVLDAVPAPLVVAMGHTAWVALHAIRPTPASFADLLGRPRPWRRRWLVTSYHPSPLAMAAPARRAALQAQWRAISGWMSQPQSAASCGGPHATAF